MGIFKRKKITTPPCPMCGELAYWHKGMSSCINDECDSKMVTMFRKRFLPQYKTNAEMKYHVEKEYKEVNNGT